MVKLKALLDSGAITQEEFEAKKKRDSEINRNRKRRPRGLLFSIASPIPIKIDDIGRIW